MPMIDIFTPSFADADNTNAQNLTVKEVVARLPEELFRVTMLCSGAPDPRIAVRKNTKLLPQRSYGNALLWSAQVLISQPDVYFFPRTGPLDRVVFAMCKARILNTATVAYIVMVMNAETETGLIGRSIRESDTVLANSEYVAQTIEERFGIKSRTILDGIDRRFFFPGAGSSNKGPDCLTVLYAGSFQERKRVDVVIKQAVRWPQVSFRLAGKGTTETSCRVLVEELGCKNVSFLGHLSSAQLGEEMRQADIFLFPSILEGHPQVLGQAAACGLPCIAMNCYRPEYVRDHETGFLVESDAELAQKLDLLLGNSDLRQSMAAAAVTYSQKFDWDHIAEQWGEVFREVTGR
jgi:glycosyltransferase involved in cell wall biosynthesis